MRDYDFGGLIARLEPHGDALGRLAAGIDAPGDDDDDAPTPPPEE